MKKGNRNAMSQKAATKKVSFSKSDLDGFHKHAPAALRRRGWNYLREETLAGAQTILIGVVPIIGLTLWGWSPVEMLIFLLVGVWLNIFCDAAKVTLLHKRAEAFQKAMDNDFHVWVVTNGLRKGTQLVYPSHVRSQLKLFQGTLVDFVMGGISTLMIIIMLQAQGWLNLTPFDSQGFTWSLFSVVTLKVASTIMEILQHRVHDDLHDGSKPEENAEFDRPVRVSVGIRGVGLFMMGFLTAFLTEQENPAADVPKVIMLVIYSLVIVVGLCNLFTPLLLLRESRWLKSYLAKRNG